MSLAQIAVQKKERKKHVIRESRSKGEADRSGTVEIQSRSAAGRVNGIECHGRKFNCKQSESGAGGRRGSGAV